MTEFVDLHYKHDGRPVSIKPDRVIRVEEASDGGTFIVINEGDPSGAFGLTVKEAYEDVRYYLTEGPNARILRKMAEKDGRPFDREKPFGDGPFGA